MINIGLFILAVFFDFLVEFFDEPVELHALGLWGLEDFGFLSLKTGGVLLAGTFFAANTTGSLGKGSSPYDSYELSEIKEIMS